MENVISVIIPVYNTKDYLSACIDSVLSQSGVKTEILLIDDGSTDGSSEICDKYQAEGSVKAFHTENHGVSHARNVGLDNAKGKYITFLDSDDLMLPGALKTMLDMIREYNADIAVGKKQYSDKEGNTGETVYPEQEELWNGREGLEQSLKDHPATYAVWGKLYSASLLEDIRFEEGRAVHEDSFFVFLCMLKEPRVIVRNIALIHYNISENSASRSDFSEKFFDILYFARRKDELIKENCPELSYLTENLLIKAHLALLNNLSKTNDKKYREAERQSLRYVKEHKNAFIPATENDKKQMKIIVSGLYYIKKKIKLNLKGVFL